MQNKPNLQKAKMNVSILLQIDYENKRNWTIGQNKPNSNPIQTQFKPNQTQFPKGQNRLPENPATPEKT